MTHQVQLNSVLRAVVLGGNVLARRSGASKQRRRVPKKQETLLTAVVPNGRAGWDRLVDAFPADWQRIRRRRSDEYILVPRREFFRNIADLAGRINDALAAGYTDDHSQSEMLGLTGGEFFGLEFDHQRFEVWWFSVSLLPDFTDTVHRTSGKTHVPFTDRGRNAASEDPKTAVDEDSEYDQGRTPGVEQPSESSRPGVHSAAVFEDFNQDAVTGVWRFRFRGHEVEVEPRHGYVKIDGLLRQRDSFCGLHDPEQIPVEQLTSLIQDLKLN